MGNFLSKALFGSRKSIDENKLNQYMAPTQALVTEQLGYGRDMMDPNSQMNLAYKNHLMSQARTQGMDMASNMRKIASQTGVSPAQAMMQARMGQNQISGQSGGNLMNWMQGQQQAGLGLMGDMTGMQQGLNENQANAYVQQINAHNQARASNIGNMFGLAGAALGGWGASKSGTTITNTG